MSWLENATPATHADALWVILQALKAAPLGGVARTVRTSGSGSGGVYSQAGDVIATADILTNEGAWFALRCAPSRDGDVTFTREFCFQTDGAHGLRIKYSPRSGFTGGAPSASRVPSAADERLVWGGGTDVAPTYAQLLPSNGNRLQGYASEGDDRFWFLAYPVGGGPASSFFFLDLPDPILLDAVQGLRDKDPAVIYARFNADCALETALASEAVGPRSVFFYADGQLPSRELWGRCPALTSYARDSAGNPQLVFPGGMPSSQVWSPPSSPEEVPRYARRALLSGTLLSGEQGNSATVDDKGRSSMLRWSATTRGTPELVDLLDPTSGGVSPGAKFAVGHVVLDWSGTPILV